MKRWKPSSPSIWLCRAFGAAILLLAAAPALASALEGADQEKYQPSNEFRTQVVRGWILRVHKDLRDEKRERIAERLETRLREDLDELNRRIPRTALRDLHAVPIWVHWKNPAAEGDAAVARYHASREWLFHNGRNPDKEKAIEIPDAERYLESRKDRPFALLHELAHAFHHRVLGFDNERIGKTWKKASKNTLLKGHPGLADEKEFFAEFSLAFLAKSPYFPERRAQLYGQAPEVYRLMREVWEEGRERPKP